MQRWLWVALPDVLDPVLGEPSFWTCHPDTRVGDVALLYRAEVRKDFSHVFKVRGNPVASREFKREFNQEYGCDVDVVAELRDPITLAQVRSARGLSRWPALQMNFHGGAFPISKTEWAALVSLASPLDRPRLRTVGG